MSMTKSRGPLWNLSFVLMLLGQVVSNTGTQIYRVALTALVLSVYGPHIYGVTMTLSAVPPIVFIILGGIVCDRYPKHRIMAATDFIRHFHCCPVV